jgi:hypothetical protein
MGHRLRMRLREHYENFASQMQKAHYHDFWSWTTPAGQKPRLVQEIMSLSPDDGRMSITLSREEYVSLVDALAADFRGCELPGFVDPKLIGPLLRSQSVNWKNIALAFFRNVYELVHCFMQSAISYITDEHRARVIYEKHITLALERRQESLALKLDELVKAFIQKPLTTHNILYTQSRDRIQALH